MDRDASNAFFTEQLTEHQFVSRANVTTYGGIASNLLSFRVCWAFGDNRDFFGESDLGAIEEKDFVFLAAQEKAEGVGLGDSVLGNLRHVAFAGETGGDGRDERGRKPVGFVGTMSAINREGVGKVGERGEFAGLHQGSCAVGARRAEEATPESDVGMAGVTDPECPEREPIAVIGHVTVQLGKLADRARRGLVAQKHGDNTAIDDARREVGRNVVVNGWVDGGADLDGVLSASDAPFQRDLQIGAHRIRKFILRVDRWALRTFRMNAATSALPIILHVNSRTGWPVLAAMASATWRALLTTDFRVATSRAGWATLRLR